MITLATDQAALMQSSSVGMVTLVHLTTYTDRTALTVSKEFWFSTPHPVRYEWDGGAARDFLDVIDSVSFSGDGFSHLPNPKDIRRATARLNLVADQVDGVNLWKTLSAETLHRAKLEIATLLVNPAQYGKAAWWDLTALAGTEHVVRFRGVLSGSGEISEEIIRLEAMADEAPIHWLRATDATEVDPRDIGRRYPIPFGAAKGVPCINREVGWYTTLAQSIGATDTGNKQFTDLTGAPAGSATYQIGSERVTATKVSNTLLNITARGVSGTTKVLHNMGEPVLELISATVLVVSAVPIKAVDALYFVNQASQERVLVTTPYSVTLSDAVVDSGEYLTTVRFTSDQLQQLLDSVEPSPTASTSTSIVLIPLNSYSEITDGADTDTSSTAGTKHMHANTSIEEKLRAAVAGAGDIPSPDTRVVSRWRVKVSCTGFGHTSHNTYLRAQAVAFGQSPATTTLYNFHIGANETLTLAGPWNTPTGQTLADAIGDYVNFWLDTEESGSSPDLVDISQAWLEVEIESTEVPPTPSHGAAQGGLGLLFVADVQGVPAPGAWAAWSLGYTFNEGTGWSLLNATQTDMGAAGQKITSTGTTTPLVQRNATSATVDLNAPPPMPSTQDVVSYRLAVTADNKSKLSSIFVYLSSATGTGTTIPTQHRLIRFDDLSALVEDTEVLLENTSVSDQGITNLADIETIQVVMVTTDGVAPFPSITVRQLERKAPGDVMTKGDDIARWFVEEMAGEEIDATSFALMGTNLDSGSSTVFAGQYDAYGESLLQVMAGLGFDMRTNFRRSPVDQKWYAFNGESTAGVFYFPSAVKTLPTLDTLQEYLKSVGEIATIAYGYYSLRRWEDPFIADNYDGLEMVNYAATTAALGVIDAAPLLFFGIGDAVTAGDVLRMYGRYNGTRYKYRRWSVTVPLWDGYDLEPGDIVALRPRWRDADAKARVLEVLIGANEAAVGLALEEVD